MTRTATKTTPHLNTVAPTDPQLTRDEWNEIIIAEYAATCFCTPEEARHMVTDVCFDTNTDSYNRDTRVVYGYRNIVAL